MKILIYKNIDVLAEAFCENLIELVSGSEQFNIALSGGNTPNVIFQTLSDKYSRKINWNKINLFWGDERCVLPEDKESNYGSARKYLIDNVDIPEKNIFRIKGEDNPDEEAERYSQILIRNLPDVNGLPKFDLTILGIGEDGHTASIFPDQMHLLSSKRICEVAVHPSTKQKRITLTGKTINNSENIFFLVSGKTKARVVSKVIKMTGNYLNYPSYYIKPSNDAVTWFLDEIAASELKN